MSSKMREVLALCCLLCAYSVGCNHYHQVQVRVFDPETGAPVVGADVSVLYFIYLDLNPPKRAAAKTNERGDAQLECADCPGEFFARAANYSETTKNLSGDSVVEIGMYKSPPPHITIALPAGFRGPVMLSFEPIKEWVQGAIGQREFTFVADARGRVRIPATSLFTQRLPGFNISASEGGRPLPNPFFDQPTTIGFRSVDSDVRLLRRVYVVGTQADRDELSDRFNKPIGGGSTASDPAAFDRFWNARFATTGS